MTTPNIIKHVLLEYPNIYPEKEPLDAVKIELEHTRAANSITIAFDGDRDGWIVYRDVTKYIDGYSEVIEKDKELVFIPAWTMGE